MIYVASPYTYPTPAVRKERYLAALSYAHKLMASGEIAFSAIVYGHPFAIDLHAPVEFEHWRSLNHHMIFLSREVHVLMLDGWTDSRGIKDEIAYAGEIEKPVKYITP